MTTFQLILYLSCYLDSSQHVLSASISTAMFEPQTLIYAELLSNIRQISVIATLRSPANITTKATLSTDRHHISLHHDGTTTTLRLPGQVTSDAPLPRPTPGRIEISWRLPSSSQSSRASEENGQDIEVPWLATSIREDTELACRECRSTLVKSKSISVWKDLPSENWAEMMEFWHCHKPDDLPEQNGNRNGSNGHASHDHAHDESCSVDHNANRGYGANTKFLATAGTGFADITSFLLSTSDCNNVQVRELLIVLYIVIVVHISLGIKKATKPAPRFSVAWLPIQMPKMNSQLPYRASGS